MSPTVTVVIPCHNYGRYLPQAVGSVVAQTFDDWELVIVDDGSTDDSAAVAESLIAGHLDLRIHLLRQANGGVSAARNAGIAAGTGRFVLPLDADDVLAPTMLEKTVGVLDGTPGIAIVSTDVSVFSEDGLPPQTLRLPAYDAELMLRQMIMFYCSLYRREVWQTVGGYDEEMRAGEDWDFWIACTEHGFDARHLPEPLFAARNKDTGLHLESARDDLRIRARIVANHPTLFKPITRAWAHAVLTPDPATTHPDARVPDEILTRATEMNQFLQAAMALQHTNRRQYHHIQRLERALAAATPTQPRSGEPSGLRAQV